jgi:Fur family peroxide stress response transcriptional regulator
MRTLVTKIDSFLREKGIKASYQRLRIFDYLQKSKEHPTVSTIYDDLLPEIPSLSRATVYNTLNLFVDKRIAKVLPLEDHEARFDIMAEDHAHFDVTPVGRSMIYLQKTWIFTLRTCPATLFGKQRC